MPGMQGRRILKSDKEAIDKKILRIKKEEGLTNLTLAERFSVSGAYIQNLVKKDRLKIKQTGKAI